MNTKEKRKVRNLVYHLIKNGKVKTTVPMAKEVKTRAEKLITKAKKDTVANRRYVAKTLSSEAVSRLFEVIGPAHKDRNGGYTRLLRLDGTRKGDGSEVCILEILDV